MKATCVVCGAEFEKRVHNAKTCGAECRSTREQEYQGKYQRRWRAENPEYQRRWRAENPEKVNAYDRSCWDRSYRDKNREKLKEKDRRYYAKNRRKKIDCSRRYYAKNRQKVLNYGRRWRAENPEYGRQWDRLRCAAKRLGIPRLLYAAMKFVERSANPSESNSERA